MCRFFLFEKDQNKSVENVDLNSYLLFMNLKKSTQTVTASTHSVTFSELIADTSYSLLNCKMCMISGIITIVLELNKVQKSTSMFQL